MKKSNISQESRLKVLNKIWKMQKVLFIIGKHCNRTNKSKMESKVVDMTMKSYRIVERL